MALQAMGSMPFESALRSEMLGDLSWFLLSRGTLLPASQGVEGMHAAIQLAVVHMTTMRPTLPGRTWQRAERHQRAGSRYNPDGHLIPWVLERPTDSILRGIACGLEQCSI